LAEFPPIPSTKLFMTLRHRRMKLGDRFDLKARERAWFEPPYLNANRLSLICRTIRSDTFFSNVCSIYPAGAFKYVDAAALKKMIEGASPKSKGLFPAEKTRRGARRIK
jgi:hypothetical protein